MSEANKNLAREWFERVWNQKSEAAIDRMFHPDGKCYGFPKPDAVLTSPEDFKVIHRSFCGAFPDLHIEIEELVAEGDVVAVRWQITMTHRGDHLGIPASGKRASLSGASFIIVKGAQITEGWNYMDLQAMLMQLRAD